MRLRFAGALSAFVMLNEVKHQANEWSQRLFPCSAQILRCRSELALSVAEEMTEGAHLRHEIRSHTRTAYDAGRSGGVSVVAVTALLEEVLEQAGAVVGEDAGGDFEPVVEPAVADDVVETAAGAGLGIGAAVDEPVEPGQDQRPAHIGHGSSVT